MVRDQVADGTLAPGAPAPSGAALARITGYSVLTYRRALRGLIADGVLVQGASGNARPRVPGPGPGDKALADAKRDLSRALASHRRAAGLTQPQLAELTGFSPTAVAHAETGRLWQGRPFWEHADKFLNAGGELLRLHDALRAAEASPEEPVSPQEPTETEGTTVTLGTPGTVAGIAITWTDGEVTTGLPARQGTTAGTRHSRRVNASHG
jgi:DNA-binding XRE family transcriptional regulator